MAKKKSDALKRRELPVWASISLIVVLGLTALVLVYAALQQVNRGSENQGFSTIESVQDEATLFPVPSGDGVPETPSAEETVAEAAPNNEPFALVSPTRLIALDQNLAVRAIVGECEAGTSGNLEFSHDGGSTWNPSPSFTETSATQVLRLLPSADGRTFVVVLNAECTPQIYSTADSGQTWVAPVSAVGTWYLDPASPRQLGAPGGVKTIGL